MIPERPHSSTRPVRRGDHSWLLTIACAGTLLAVLIIAVQVGAPLPVVLLGLVAACLLACGWIVFAAVRTRKQVDAALQAAIERGGLAR